jgi:hypothetical protein
VAYQVTQEPGLSLKGLRYTIHVREGSLAALDGDGLRQRNQWRLIIVVIVVTFVIAA